MFTDSGLCSTITIQSRLVAAGLDLVVHVSQDRMPSGNENAELFSELLDAMSHTDVPKARPNFARQVEATGLTLLSLSLRLNHVIRVTENLKLINTDHLSRTVSLDVDLRNLTALQRQALAVQEPPPTVSEPPSTATTDRLWVPISRHSREDLAPVVVKDEDGTVVPRLTQQAATNAVIAGVTRLFRMQLRSQRPVDPAGRSRDDEHRARWLIETAIARLIEHGIHGKPQTVATSSTEEPVEEPKKEPVREIARDFLLNMAAHQARHYAELLKAASREYFLIVMLRADESHQFLTYEAPLIPAVRSSTARRRAWKALLPFSTEFNVDYVTQIPRSVGSYHVTVDVPEEIDVRRFILSSDAEELAVEDLARRIDALTNAELNSRYRPSVIAAERSEVEAMLGVLGQRRHLDVEGFDYYLHNRDLPQGPAGDGDHRNLDPASPGISDLRRRQGVRTDLPGDRAEDPAGLARVGRWIQSAQLGLDVSTDNDPRENGAHAQWRPIPLGFGHPSVEPVEARVFLALADEPPALVESVARMVGALVVVVVGVLLAAATGSDVWSQGRHVLKFAQADATVAVLLIVPGIMLTRLDIQSTHSVLGRLRRFPQTVAYLSVAFTTGLALVVAGANEDAKVLWWGFEICAGLLAFLFGLCLLEKAARRYRRKVLVPASATIPAWLRQEFRTGRRPKPLHIGQTRQTVRPDVYFDAIRPVPNTTRLADQAYEDRAAKREDGQLDRRLGTPEGPALLADLAARAVAEDDTVTEIEIIHSSAQLPHDKLATPDEVLYTSWDGLAFQVSVKSRREHDLESVTRLALVEDQLAGPIRRLVESTPLLPRPVRQALIDVTKEVQEDKGTPTARWIERSPLLPVSIRSNTTDVDFLAEFTLADPNWCYQAIPMFLHACLTAAREAGIVPTLVNTPAARAQRNAPEELQFASGPTLRLTFTVPYGKHAERLAFESAVVAIASEQGIDLYRADRRPDAGQGDWEQVTESRPVTDPSTGADEDLRTTCHGDRPVLVPLTFIGRRGEEGVEAFLKLAEVLMKGEVRVAALTASVMGQHAVVNVLAEARGARDAGAAVADQPCGMADALDAMLARGIVETHFWDREKIRKGIGFEVCIGVAPGERLPQPATGGEVGRSLWIDWELPMHALTERQLAQMFRQECDQTIGGAEIRFWRTRAGSDERVRGRAKLAVEPRESQAITEAGFNIGDRAKAVQAQLVHRLRAELPWAPPYSVFLHVVWTEPWLTRRRGT